jgi:acetoacetyl-CoA synthetase
MTVVWQPAEDAADTTQMGRFLQRWAPPDVDPANHEDAWRWSVTHLDDFWTAVWTHFGVRSATPPGPALADDSMPGAVWFPGARINYAAHLLADNGRHPDDVTVIARSQSRTRRTLTLADLRTQVARARVGLADLGVTNGTRVAAFMPNVPETLVAMLATASLGAIWASVAPEFGVRSVVDRLRQVEPSVLLAVDGYRYGDKAIDRRDEVAEIRAALPSLDAVVGLGYLDADATLPDAITWHDLLANDATAADLAHEPVAFDHPLYILFSSGTTGLPKPIVHGHGGILVEHLKMLGLHTDLGPDDRFFWFSTTGWMMWNYLVSAGLVGATTVMFDGDPGHPDLLALWRLAAEERLTYLGVSAPFIMACRKQGLVPRAHVDLHRLRGVGSTGAPLPAAGFEWVLEAVSPTVQVGSISGGTDVCTAFVGPSPLAPVVLGEIPARALGARVEAWDEHGTPVVGTQGELMITAPMPSMPVGFWGDDDGRRYREAYFSQHPGAWRHGDWITITERGSCIITGRSDATLNRGGVRLGTSEFYAVVDARPEVADSLVVHVRDPDDPDDTMGELILFVAAAPGTAIDDEVLAGIRADLRTELSPRHVPDRIVVMPAIPRTLSGKRLEVPVKRILTGTPVDRAASPGALANPSSLQPFADWARQRLAGASDHAGTAPSEASVDVDVGDAADH